MKNDSDKNVMSTNLIEICWKSPSIYTFELSMKSKEIEKELKTKYMSTKLKRMTGSLFPAKINKDIISKWNFGACTQTNRNSIKQTKTKESLYSIGSVRKFTNVERLERQVYDCQSRSCFRLRTTSQSLCTISCTFNKWAIEQKMKSKNTQTDTPLLLV